MSTGKTTHPTRTHIAQGNSDSVRPRDGFRWGSISRVAWLVMVVAHIPALIAACRAVIESGFDPSRLGACVALALATLFFILKTANVSFLRWKTDRRSCVALGMIVVLLHIDALRPQIFQVAVPVGATIVLTVAVVTIVPRRLRLLALAIRRSGVFGRCRTHAPHGNTTAWCDERRPHCWLLASSLFALRAPPQ